MVKSTRTQIRAQISMLLILLLLMTSLVLPIQAIGWVEPVAVSNT